MAESVQYKLTRVRPPRVKITYDVETLGAIQQRELPFIVGVFAGLSGATDAGEVRDRKMVEIDRDNFDTVLGKIRPSVKLSGVPVSDGLKKDLEKDVGDFEFLTSTVEEDRDGSSAAGAPAAGTAEATTGGGEEASTGETEDGDESAEAAEPAAAESAGPEPSGNLEFRKIEDFHPESLIGRVDQLRTIYGKRQHLRDMQTRLETRSDLYKTADRILQVALLKKEDSDREIPEELKEAEALLAALQTAFAQDAPADWAASDADADANALVESMRLTRIDADDDTVSPLLKDRAAAEDAYNRQLVGRFVWDVVVGATAAKVADPEEAEELRQKGLFAYFDLRVATIDEIISEQLSALLHFEDFQKLEATWRGLRYLVFRAETGQMLKIRVMNISKDDFRKDLVKAVEFDQSHSFKLIYEAEYGTYGGDPYSLLIGDYEFDRSNEDMTLLNKVAELAAAAHAPFIAAAYSELFNLRDFDELAKPRDLAKIFDSVELARWRSFRESEDSRYVTLTLPKVMLRLPYGGKRGEPIESFDFKEKVDGESRTGFLWGNPAYVLGDRVTNAFSIYGWTAAIRGVEGGGLVEGLPKYDFETADGDVSMVCPTQVTITDRREKEINDLGFLAICHRKSSDQAAFFGGQTTNKPKKYFNNAANANAELSSRLPYILCASRFAHYIKVIMREKVGSFLTRANVEVYLNTWISNYVLLDDDATQASKAAYPLRAARIEVTEVPGKPGVYKSIAFIRPHFQLEELTTSIRLVAEIPA